MSNLLNKAMPIFLTRIHGIHKLRLNKGSRALALFAVLLLATEIQYVKEAHAEGMTSHELISYMVQQSATGQLRSLLDTQQDSYRNGSIFPDVAQSYLGDVEWSGAYSRDDASHGQQPKNNVPKAEGILNEYLKLLKERCGTLSQSEANIECKQALAFYLGYISHVIADGPWHAKFIYGDKGLKSHCEFKHYPPPRQKEDTVHKFADNAIDICMAKKVNGVPSPDLELDPDLKTAVFTRKNTRVGQGCPDGQWWHLGGGDGLLGACWKCDAGYSHDSGKTPIQKGVCYKKRIIACSQINQGKIGFSVSANILGFSIVETGYWFAAEAYNRMNEMNGYEHIGDKTSKVGLINKAKGDLFLKTLTFAQHAGKTDFEDPGYAATCSWGFKNAVDGDGGIKESAARVNAFIDKIWNHLQRNEEFSIVRLDAYNYGVWRNGQYELCVMPKSGIDCPLK